ncbi:hypothetical protein [Streptomyces sp. NPDC007063]|uniref:hypothetical protein n=1 Tax=Streptomyces sp. NPDC007063 TaxID=3364772 RepID=UPI0036A7D91C
MARKDNYASDQNPDHCGHPNQVPFVLPDDSSGTGSSLHVKCGDDSKPGCGEEWPK